MSGKIEDTVKEVAGAAEQQWGEATDSPRHRVRGAARRYSNPPSSAPCHALVRDTALFRAITACGLAVAAGVGVFIGFLLGRK